MLIIKYVSRSGRTDSTKHLLSEFADVSQEAKNTLASTKKVSKPMNIRESQAKALAMHFTVPLFKGWKSMDRS